ncbi:Z1 domain-containing protein [Pararhodobacter aggregans]|uniref:Z1 domain-containing protein n=1 Tax=Pararhodobacter aggregans TaxID=404875 RepID=UPI003A90BA4C
MMSDSRDFADILKASEPFVRRQIDKTGELVTADLIDSVLRKVEMIDPDLFENVDREAVIDEMIRRSSHGVGKDASLVGDEGHEPWLNADRKTGWRYWRRYREHMETKLPWKALDALEKSTDEILGNLEDPQRPGPWDRRGLVVGHVQSGKTGNYTGLICKAADAGYKVIIVLAGLHNNLRAQTQIRLDEGFLGYATLVNVDNLPLVGVGLLDKDKKSQPNCATNRSDKGDFDTAMSRKLNVKPEERPWLFVVKKQKNVLERLVYWLENHAADTVDPVTGRKIVTALPALVIDDESDHGSVDTGETPVGDDGQPDLEHSPTILNGLIRQVLNTFSRKAYVGYTATPFANIFIHEKSATAEHGPDLFPSAFITSLGAPTNYIGPGRVFGSASSVPEDLPLARTLDDADYLEWMPPTHKNGWRPRIGGERRLPDGLQEAIRSFVFACAVRKVRGQGDKHSSMLIHVSRFTSVQGEIVAQVEDFVRHMTRRYERNVDLSELDALMHSDFEGRFHPEMVRVRDAFPDVPQGEDVSWPEVRAVLPSVLQDIDVREINGSAKDALDYAENEKQGLKVIAIGGDKLARGLTLEGLCTSYFLRTTKMYDTLMQMGRWFGYRDKYLDVCRLYTSREMIQWFGHIADAAEELRQEFDNMVAVKGTPKDFGLRVKSHSVLTVTSKAKMRSAKPVHLTYSGDLLQTVAFPIDGRHEQNFAAGEALIGTMGVPVPLQDQRYVPEGQSWNGWLWRNVPAMAVVEFLRTYQTHPTSFRVVPQMIADFIAAMNLDQELTQWTVALVGADAGDPGIVGGLTVGMLRRNATGDHADRYSIKTLISPRDEAIDLTRAQREAAIERSRETWRGDAERNESKGPPDDPRGPAIRHIRGFGHEGLGVAADRVRGLLLLYLLDPGKAGASALEGRAPVFAWSLSFPGSPSKRRIRDADYMANSVLWGELSNGLE